MGTHHTPINVVKSLQLLGLRVLIDHLPSYMPQILKYILWDRKKIFRCILDIANYATYEYILAFKKRWGSHTFHDLKLKLISWFDEPSYLIEKFISDLETL